MEVGAGPTPSYEDGDGVPVETAVSEEQIRDHGACANVKVSEILRATAVDVHRPDPERLTV